MVWCSGFFFLGGVGGGSFFSIKMGVTRVMFSPPKLIWVCKYGHKATTCYFVIYIFIRNTAIIRPMPPLLLQRLTLILVLALFLLTIFILSWLVYPRYLICIKLLSPSLEQQVMIGKSVSTNIYLSKVWRWIYLPLSFKDKCSNPKLIFLEIGWVFSFY